MSKYYVYHAYGIDNELLYIGKGSGERYKHCINGTSHVKDLNRYFFMNGENGSINVKIVEYFSSEDAALKQETQDIKYLKPLFNTVNSCNRTTPSLASKDMSIVEKVENDCFVPFSSLIREYVHAYKTDDINTILRINAKTTLCDRYYKVLGVDKIEQCNFKQRKLNKAFQQAIIQDPIKRFNKHYLTIPDENLDEEYSQKIIDQLYHIESEIKDSRKVKLYAIYTSKKDLTIAEMAKEVGVSVRTTKYWIKELRNKGYLP